MTVQAFEQAPYKMPMENINSLRAEWCVQFLSYNPRISDKKGELK